MADLAVDLGCFQLKNPVMTASGTFGYGFEYNKYYDISRLGAVVVKGIRMTPSHGNPTPRVAEVTGGMLNAIGLQGPGVDKFLHGEEYMPFLRKTGAAVIVNIWGTTVAEYAEVASRLEAEKEGITALEINISCPNVKAGVFGKVYCPGKEKTFDFLKQIYTEVIDLFPAYANSLKTTLI